MKLDEWADVVTGTESNILASAMASGRIPLRGRRARHDVQCVDSNSGDPRSSSHRGSMAYNASNGGSQTAAWDVDSKSLLHTFIKLYNMRTTLHAYSVCKLLQHENIIHYHDIQQSGRVYVLLQYDNSQIKK